MRDWKEGARPVKEGGGRAQKLKAVLLLSTSKREVLERVSKRGGPS